MNCQSCGAPLPPNSTVCEYCKTRNLLDLKGVVGFSEIDNGDSHPCPHCQTILQRLHIRTQPNCWLDRCPECGGLFLPKGGIHFLLDQLVKSVYTSNPALLDKLRNTFYRTEKVVYRKCPYCSLAMNRQHFGYRCGIVIDRCNLHGDWLDCGELMNLLEWKKAGGMLKDQ